MSKLNLNIDDKQIEINNTLQEFLDNFVLVKKEDIKKLDELKVQRYFLTENNTTYYIVKRGKKPKKFNKKQVEYIKKDLLENKISIRKASEKYHCSPSIILQIKNNNY